MAGRAARLWLAKRGDQRRDRWGVGAGLLIMIGFVVLLLLSSSLTALGGYREIMLVLYGGLLVAATFGLVFAPTIDSWLSRWRYSRWFAILAMDARRVLFSPYGPVIVGIGCLVHALTIVIIWSLGRAQGLLFPVADAATLFTVMISVALVPISIGGWGLRELAVISPRQSRRFHRIRRCFFRCASALLLRSALCPELWRGCCIRLYRRDAPVRPADERRVSLLCG